MQLSQFYFHDTGRVGSDGAPLAPVGFCRNYLDRNLIVNLSVSS